MNINPLIVPMETVKSSYFRKMTRGIPDSSQKIMTARKTALLVHILYPEDPNTRMKFVLLPPQRIPL